MSQITIQCRLVASEASRQQLWQLMAERNTPLINELLVQVSQHPDFETWQRKGKLPAGTVQHLCKPLRTDSRFEGQPGRFYTSASKLVEYIYKSWFKLQQRRQQKLEGQRHWLEMLKSDEEIVKECNCSLDVIRAKASETLVSLHSEDESSQSSQGKEKGGDRTTRNKLFDAYDQTEDILAQNAITYLLKNHCQIPQKPEDSNKLAQHRRKTEIKISRLEEQLDASLPKGRELSGQKWLDTLVTAATTVPKDEAEAKSWQNILLTKSKPLPFPVAYETNEDLSWSKNSQGRLCVSQGRLCVSFSGLSKHSFRVYCDQRQLKWFQRFFEDQQLKRESKDQHSSALFALRSARVAWQEGTGKGRPWNVHRLILFFTVDTRFWTAEGTEQVREEKAAEIAETLTKMNEKGDLSKNQQALMRRKQSTLARLNNPFPRPSRPLYSGQSHLLVGVALGLEKPATAAIVDGSTGGAITYRSIKQLLGTNYKLLNRCRKQKQRQSHQRHKAQKRFASNQFGDSELGQYVDRLC